MTDIAASLQNPAKQIPGHPTAEKPHDITALPMVDDVGDVVGVISEADLVHRTEIGTEKVRPTWLVERSVVTIIGIAMPPRDPNDADDEDEEDEEDEDRNDGPAVIREPDDDE
jgi:CBS domain-containing protein